ncbi:MAG: Rpn family recombination-promoting nuclease/putative transposase, partial [Bacteroidota bacterium]
MSTGSISNPHDKYIPEQLSNLELAKTFLRQFLDQQLAAVLDFDKLSLLRDSYVDEELQEFQSDLIYLCETKSGTPVEVCILLEHKSYVPARPRIQLIQYLVNAWKSQIKEKDFDTGRDGLLRPVIPVLLYHGQKRWKDRSLEDYFHKIDGAEVGKYIPKFSYDLIDLNTYSAEEVAQMNLGMLELAVVALKFSRDLEAFLAQFGRLAAVMEIHGNLETDDQRITAFFVYLYSTSKVSPEDLFNLLQENMPETL